MKSQLSLILTSMLLIVLCSSCKKETESSSPGPTNEYATSLKEKNWWGKFTDDKGFLQYYNVYFAGDNTLQWSENAGDYNGHWSLDENHLTMTVDGPVTGVRADITGDKKLANLKSSAGYTLTSGQMMVDTKFSLENTAWAGTISDPGIDLKLTFLTGSKVRLQFDVHINDPFDYTRAQSGAYIRFNAEDSHYFGVQTSANSMAGTTTYLDFDPIPWQVSR